MADNNPNHRHKPQQTFLFRLVAFISRLQFSYLLRALKNTRIIIFGFTVTAGVSAIAIISAIASFTELPLLFPPLAPSAFILFYMPMSETGSPRNLILGHTISLLCGLVALHVITSFLPGASILEPSALNYANILAISMAMGLSTAFMVGFKCAHPPATATALIASMGFIATPIQAAGLVAAVVFLALEAFFFVRILGGIPYPYWRFNPQAAIHYKDLSGRTDSVSTNWEELSKQIFKKRK